MKPKNILFSLVNVLFGFCSYFWFGVNIAFALNTGQFYKADAEGFGPIFILVIVLSLCILFFLERKMYRASRQPLRRFVLEQALSWLAGLLLFTLFVLLPYELRRL